MPCTGSVTGDLVHLGTGREEVIVDVTGPTTMHLLGGEPLDEQVVMLGNFVGRNEAAVAARTQWQAPDPRCGEVDGWDDDAWLCAPELLSVRPRPRG